ncbi:MAG: OmpA family protein [Pseudomonadota bacterium]
MCVANVTLSVLLVWVSGINAALAATPPGTLINNTATVTFSDIAGDPVVVNSNTVAVTSVFGRTPASTGFVRLVDAPVALAERRGPTRCLSGGAFALLPAPVGNDGQPLDLTNALPGVEAGIFNADETAFLRLADGDQNLDANLRETVEVTVRNNDSGDSETLELLETDRNTGIFSGYIPLANDAAVNGNCVLEGASDSTLQIDYTDPADATDVVQAQALVEPLSVVFDAVTGQPVNGATITLVDNATGLPATVFGNDGVSLYPSTVVSGQQATDASGIVYSVPDGGFRFPVVAAGRYRLSVTPPTAYLAPSLRSVDELNALPNAPFDLGDASFANVFEQLAAGVTTLVDIPLDPFDGGLFLTKNTTLTTAAVGDFVPYTLTLENSSSRAPATSVQLTDTPAPGLRFVAGSARLDGNVIADPTMLANTAGAFEFNLPPLAPEQRVTLTYVLEVTGGARGKQATNAALAVADGDVVSNEALVAIALREDLFRSRSTLIGRVVEADCTAERFADDVGVAGVRIYLEDGQFVVTDEHGRFHMEGLEPGRHTVQMDNLTIPEWLELARCDDAPRFGRRADSQWVNLSAGLVERADFYLKRKAANTGEVALRLINSDGATPDIINYELSVTGNGAVALDAVSATVLLPEGATLQPGTSRLNNQLLPSPRMAGNAVVFVLGDRTGRWSDTVTFSASIDPSYSGELVSRAVVNFNTPTAKNQRTPVGEARMQREAATTENADYVLALGFDVLSAQLSPTDRESLDVLIDQWRGVYNIQISAIGHTDSDRIAARNRHIFADNYALSEARAAAAAQYLADALDVPASAITVRGNGADKPVASNDTADGRKRNRRVELVMTGLRPGRQAAVEVTQRDSGLQTQLTTADKPGPDSLTDPLDEKIRRNEALAETEDAPQVPAFAELPTSNGFVLPTESYQPAIPSITIAISHLPTHRVELLLNDQRVNALNFEGMATDGDRTRSVSTWRGVDLAMGENQMLARVVDENGALVDEYRRTVHYAGQPVRGKLLPEQSRLIADGRQRPVLAIRLFDGEDQPARAASIGNFSLDQPYRSWFEVSRDRDNDLVRIGERTPFFRVGPDGIAYIELEPTTQAGEVTLRLQFPNEREQELRAFLKPAPRDWILVGFAEGTLGYNTLRDNTTLAQAAELEDEFFKDGRVAFFAKGRIKGDALLTIAYDTRGRADDRDAFRTEVDPDQFFTLYGDGTESRFEAASQRKLYVKLERNQFVALFGDYSTGLSTTELSRYERRFNGLQAQYVGSRFTFNSFAAESDQAFSRDDISGNGTSGLYRLTSQNLVINSEQIRIETRDRFNASQVLETRRLTRYLDYDIDYINGTLFFKRPIPSRDQNLNPQIIVAEYETRNGNEDDVVAGGRATIRMLDQALEVGVTGIREENAVDANVLLGADVRWQATDNTLVTAEYADTNRDDLQQATSGYAYKVAVEHATGAIDARVFHEYSDSGFGLGQQTGNQIGVQNTGGQLRWQFAERWFLQSQVGLQENLDTGTQRRLGDAELRYDSGKFNAFAALASVRDEATDGTVRESDLARVGIAQRIWGDRLTLRAQTEQALSNNEGSLDFPARSTVGVDLNFRNVTLFAEHELAEGQNITAQTTRVGVRTTPWQRAQFTTTLDNQVSEFGPRLFANVGFIQGWQISEHWTVDVGVDHANTLIEGEPLVFDIDRPLASGSLSDDYVSAFVGALYQSDLWSANSRYEQRNADTDTSQTLVVGWFREPVAGHGFSVGLQLFDNERNDGSAQQRGDLRFGWAYRKADRQWAFLNRTDLVFEDTSTLGASRDTKRIVNNFNAVKRLSAGRELALQYASKYVVSQIDGDQFSGYTDLAGVSYRAAFSERWEYRLNGSALHSWNSDVIDYSVGAELGYNPRDNLWLSVGYNLIGFRDADFDNARYTAAGPFINVTIKADQHTLREIAGRFRGNR